MKKISILFLALCLALTTFAQSDTTRHLSRQLLLFYGMQGPELMNLNNVLNANKYPAFKQNSYAGGGSLLGYSKNILWQMQLFGYHQSQNKDTLTSFIQSYQFGYSIGYGYLMRRNFQMYTLLGLNYWWTTFKETRNIPSPTSFNGYFSATGNQYEMTTEKFTTNLETHIDYIFNPSKDPNEKDRLILGIAGGYHLQLNKSKWLMNKSKLDNGPDINPGGYYVMFILGLKYE